MKNKKEIISKRQRRLTTQKYAPSSILSFDLPAGEVIKRFQVTVKGYITHTFAAGAPAMSKKVERAGISHALLKSISILTDGGELRKKVDIKWLRDMAKMVYGSDAPSYYQKNNQTVDSETEGFPTIGTTAQKTAFVDSFEIPMENVLSSSSALTYLNLKGKTSSTIEIECSALSELILASGDQVDSTAHDITIEISMTTAPHFRDSRFGTFRQTIKPIEFSGAPSSSPVELNRGGNIQGLFLEVYKGQDKEPLTIEEFSNCKFQLVKNGTEILRDVTGHQLITENLSGTPMQSIVKSTGYISLLNNRAANTGLDTSVGSDVQALDLLVTLPSSLSYGTYPVRLEIKQDELVKLD